MNGILTFAELHAGLRNMGINPECGACMEIFWTGMTTAEHNDCSVNNSSVIITGESNE